MANFAQALGNLGNMMGGATNTYTALQERKRKEMMEDLQRRAFVQNMQMQEQQWQTQQGELQRQRTAASYAANALGNNQQPPQQLPMPGARPIPGAVNQNSGVPILGATPQRSPMPPQLPPAGGGPGPGMAPGKPQQPAQGGLSINQLADNIRAQHPDIDPLTLMDTMDKLAPYLKQEEQEVYRRDSLELRERLAKVTEEMAELKANKPDSGAAVSRREMENQARAHGVDPTGKSDAELNALVSKQTKSELDDKSGKRNKPSAQEWRYTVAQKQVKGTADDIKKTLAAHPLSVGAYGKIYKGVGGAYGLMREPEPDDAAAANHLHEKFEELAQQLGVVGSIGGMGSSTLAKMWEKNIGGEDWLTNPSKLNDYLDSITGEVDRFHVPAGETSDGGDAGGWSIQPVE